jgi:class 3 adenylate cyclase
MPRRPQAPERLLATVLFTDIVRSTERAAEMGDKQWRRVISAYHALVRRQLKRYSVEARHRLAEGLAAAAGEAVALFEPLPGESELVSGGVLPRSKGASPQEGSF